MSLPTPLDPERILASLSFDDKCRLLAGGDMWRTHAQPAAHLPYIKLSDGPVGTRGGGGLLDSVPAALFPSASALGATFDTGLAYDMGRWIARDARSKQVHVVLGPTINIVRDPRNGRAFETYSEDALLCGTLGSSWVRGCQSIGVGATPKHFVGNEVEFQRRFSSSNIDERTLREIYLKPFQIVLRDVKRAYLSGGDGNPRVCSSAFEGQPSSLMTAYNRLHRTSASEHERLWNQVVRQEWGYDGLVVSDWFALHAHALKTTDLEMPGPTIYRSPTQVRQLLAQGHITEKDIDDRARRVLQLIKRVEPLGLLFDPRQEKEEIVRSDELSHSIRTIGAEAAVLLKNDGGILPLSFSPGKVQKIALIGGPVQDAKSFQSGGGSANLTSQYTSSPLDALKEALSGPDQGSDLGFGQPSRTELTYAEGVPLWEFPPGPPLRGKVTLDFFNGKHSGEHSLFATLQTDEVQWGKNFVQPPAGAKVGDWFLRANFVIDPPQAGRHKLAIVGLGTVHVSLDLGTDTDDVQSQGQRQDRAQGQTFQWRETFEKDIAMVAINPTRGWVSRAFNWPAHPVQVSIEYRPPDTYDRNEGTNAWARNHHFALLLAGWIPEQGDSALIDRAAHVASEADLAIVFVGTGNKFEGEENDRETLTLPKGQDVLVQAVLDHQPHTAVVSLTGAPVSMPWFDQARAVVQTWFGGQESGHAIADVLLGRGEAPASGRLPSTWPRLTAHLPTAGKDRLFPGVEEADDPVGPNVYYDEGLLVGYAHYEAHAVEPLAWFGQGLGGYTSFAQTLLSVEGHLQGQKSSVTVVVGVHNTGSRPGKAVVQLYALHVGGDPGTHAMDGSGRIRKLAAFGTLRLDAGQRGQLVLELDQEAFSFWTGGERGYWAVKKGSYPLVLAHSANPKDEIERTEVVVDQSWTWNGLGRV